MANDSYTAELSAEDGWRALLERGRLLKMNALHSRDFLSPADLSNRTGIDEATIREQVRHGTLFAVQNPEDGEPKIPVWACGIAGPITQSILQEGSTADSWHLYHFLKTPQGSLNGLRPVELLLSEEQSDSAQSAARQELIEYLNISGTHELLDLVMQGLKADLHQDG